MAIELRVLGTPDLLDDSGTTLQTVVVQRKRFGLLVFLAISRPAGFHQRDELLALFWPDLSEERSRNALNQALSFLRRSLGSDILPSRGSDEVGVDLALLSCDALAFLDAANRGDDETALARYAGELLPAFHTDGAPAFSDWLDQERRVLRDRAVASAKALSTRAEAQGDPTRAIEWTLRGTAIAPCDEALTRQLVLLHDRSGNPARAVQAYDDYAARIRRELDLEPSSELSALVREIRSRSAKGEAASARAVDPNANASAARLRAGPANPEPSDLEATIDRRATEPVSTASGIPRARWRRRTIALGTAAAAAVVVGGAMITRHPSNRVREFVIVADFETAPADSVIADMLTDETRRALSDSRSIGAAPENRVAAARLRLHVPNDARLTIPLARQVALGEGISTVVAGSLRRFGGGYALSIRLISASSGEELATAAGTGVGERELIVALDALTRTVRKRAGDDLEVIRAQPPLLALTSTSLEAMSNYVAAVRAPQDSAVKLLRKAVALDTSFAAALWQLSRRWAKGSDDERHALLARAYAHREGLTEYERLRVEIAYRDRDKPPNRGELVARVRELVEKYPNADDAAYLGGLYWDRRELAAAESAFKRAIALDSTNLEAYIRLSDVLLTRNQIRAARRLVDTFLRRHPSSGVYEALVTYAEGHRDKMREILQARARISTGVGIDLFLNLAWLNLLEGRVADWERDSRTLIARDSVASRLPVLKANYWVRSRPVESLPMLDALLVADTASRRNPDAAVLYAQFNQPRQARSLLAAYDSVTTNEVRHGFGEVIGRRSVMGWILVAEGRPLDAVTEFRGDQMVSDGFADSSPIAADAEIGLAFERAGLRDSAIVAYEHYLNTPYSDRFWEDAVKLAWVLEHVAALYETAGKRDKARVAYERLVDLWKDADPELQPRVMKARQRIAALNHG